MAMEKPDVAGAGQSAPAKFSRYRSVRKAASNRPDLPQSHPPLPPLDTSVQHKAPTATMSATTVKRSMSRYRRQRAPTETNASQPPVPADRALAYRGPASATQGKNEWPGREQGDRRRQRDATVRAEKFVCPEDSEDDEFRDHHRQNAMDRLTGGEKKTTGATTHRRPTTRDRAAARDREAKHSDERHYRTDGESRTRASSRRRSSHEPKRHSLKETAKVSRPTDEAPQPIDTAVGNRHPGFDAPVSAVNAGERQVYVRYRKTTMQLSVTPSTSAQDLLFIAGECLAGEIDPLKFILMESFTELGLERPLRRYEAVREVMNSWAHDKENTLIVVPGASLEALSQLDANCVSGQPAEVTLHMYYSQRLRKWDKRFITLRSDGQVTQSKKENGQESANVCHLSDFDIYSPTPGYLSNNVKPPKKICQAVKSQQKSSMFLSTENFVHFFATNDKAIADAWYRAVHAWRSWYLVNKLGAGEDKTESPAAVDEVSPSNKPFKPLLHMDSPDTSGCEGKPSKTKELFSRKKSTREHAPPPSSFPKLLADEPDLAPPPPPVSSSPDDSPFTSSGLLGRSYTLRHRAMKEREEREKKATEDPFAAQGLIGNMTRRPTNGPSSSRPNSRSNTMTSTQAPDLAGLKRSQSINKNKPLVDLTPVYQEPPQHARKGRGVAVEPGTLLIDAATGREAPGGIAVPSATTWRRPPPPPVDLPSPTEGTSRTRNRSRSRSVTARSNHPRHYNASVPASPTAASPADATQREDPFIPNSLISRSAQLAALQNNGVPIGHGVATGDRMATKPMLDMSADNPFTQGSLLRGL
ncbi:hypothetical protein P170DRAFT_472012 [Aspergillus steynii IBT 23096]|uniref:PH domain-containing protein n=1 Tax=Aspergillus steynii IBT 23096 TaxID=1392250 RepID=A0A2I2GGU8_9EURO|nr:uncharacterized protein P170DRAFT_472012 [Aspergillus steynii IBT 23096]PLB52104.1 hypothetical protein P170DRAFT_472012 [Aspergillus steynii IBT 23096]